MVLEAYGLSLVKSLCPANIQQSVHTPKLAPELLFLFVKIFAL